MDNNNNYNNNKNNNNHKLKAIEENKLCEDSGNFREMNYGGYASVFIGAFFLASDIPQTWVNDLVNLNYDPPAIVRVEQAMDGRNSWKSFLSSTEIAKKLSNVPLFYAVDVLGNVVGNKFYVSYEDAMRQIADSNCSVKVMALDQVLLNSKMMSSSSSSSSSSDLQRNVNLNLALNYDNNSDKKMEIVPSKESILAAKDMGVNMAENGNDVPLFVVNSLAFKTKKGEVVTPLFLEKSDCESTLKRLVQDGNGSGSEEASITVLSLRNVLKGMEEGMLPLASAKRMELFPLEYNRIRANILS